MRPLDVRFHVPDHRRMIAAVRPLPDHYTGAITDGMVREAVNVLPGWAYYVIGEQRSHKWKAGGMLLPNRTLEKWDAFS